MFNVIRMELFRLKKSKSFYLMFLLFALFTLFYYFNLQTQLSFLDHKAELSQTQFEHQAKEVSKQMSIDVGPLLVGKASLLEVAPKALSADLILILGTFITFFVCGESGSGFIKNTASAVRSRWYLVLSKVILMSVVAWAGIVIRLLFIGAGLSLSIEAFSIGISAKLMVYLGLKALLCIALSAYIVMLAVVLQSTAISFIVIIFDCFGILTLIIVKISPVKEIYEYLIMYNFNSLPSNFTPEAGAKVFVGSVIAIVVFNVISCYVIEKRDII